MALLLDTLIYCCCVILSVSSKETPKMEFPYGMPPPPFPGMMPPFPFPPPPFALDYPKPPKPSLSSTPNIEVQSPPKAGPNAKPSGFPASKYTYDAAASLAREVYTLVHIPHEEFLGTHMYFMLESPTARALAEYVGKVEYAKQNGGEECLANGEEAAIKNYRKLHGEVVWNCDAGWKRNPTLVKDGKELMDLIVAIDKQAGEELKNCKPDQPCYKKFKQTTLAASIDKQLKELRINQLVDLKVIAAQDHVKSQYSIYKCNADMSDPIREHIYTDIAKINVCMSNAGLVTKM